MIRTISINLYRIVKKEERLILSELQRALFDFHIMVGTRILFECIIISKKGLNHMKARTQWNDNKIPIQW